jgi:hypothetical protein
MKSLNLRLGVVVCLLLPAMFIAAKTTFADGSGKVIIQSDTLPEHVGDWVGHEVELTDAELSTLHSPAASQRLYVNQTTGEMVQVLLIQVENTQNAHDPRLCMQGSGFKNRYTREVKAPWADDHPSRNFVSHSMFAKESVERHMFYWMATPTGTVANMSVGLKLDGLLRALRGEPTKGIAVRVLGVGVQPTQETVDPERLKELWQQVRQKVDFNGLVATF